MELNAMHDGNLSALIKRVVFRRLEILKQRGSFPHLRCASGMECQQPEYHSEAVRKILCAWKEGGY